LATALVVDLRNFTPNLNASKTDDSGVNVFCRFLAEFHAICLDACTAAIPEDRRGEPPFLLWSTGDGVIVCFTDPESHVQHGYLSALVMQGVLRRVCGEYNRKSTTRGVPKISFGIGVESGRVWGVHAEKSDGGPSVHTYVGHCINVAARAQEVSKTLHRARTIIGSQTNQQLVNALAGVNYAELVSSTRQRVDDARYLAIEEEMNELNRRLCLGFIHLHTLRGLDRPIALFRVSESTTRLGNPRFEALLAQLADDDKTHIMQLREFLSHSE